MGTLESLTFLVANERRLLIAFFGLRTTRVSRVGRSARHHVRIGLVAGGEGGIGPLSVTLNGEIAQASLKRDVGGHSGSSQG